MRRIEIVKLDVNWFTVIVDDRFADRLTVDEALGVVASALFAGSDRVLYVRTYEAWAAAERAHGEYSRWSEPVAQLEHAGKGG